MSSTLRGQLLGAIAAGLALGCKTEASPPARPSPSAAPTVTAVASGDAVDAVDAAVPTCPPSTKQQTHCLAMGASAAKQGPKPKVEYEANGCAAASAVHDSCSGVEVVLSGPVVRGKECCYEICQGMVQPCGRLLLDENDRAVVADVTATAGWIGEASTLPPAARDAWLADARLEHASVAAFARFSLELMTIGAPAELVADAHRAALDEIDHARLCFSLASDPATPLGPGALALDHVPIRQRVEDIVRGAAEECCCGETFAAEVARRALIDCKHEGARAALERIAVDEARHAELGWRFVAYAIHRFGDVARDAAREGLDRGLRRLQATPSSTKRAALSNPPGSLEAYGRLTPRALVALTTEVADELIRPLRDALLDDRAA